MTVNIRYFPSFYKILVYPKIFNRNMWGCFILSIYKYDKYAYITWNMLPSPEFEYQMFLEIFISIRRFFSIQHNEMRVNHVWTRPIPKVRYFSGIRVKKSNTPFLIAKLTSLSGNLRCFIFLLATCFKWNRHPIIFASGKWSTTIKKNAHSKSSPMQEVSKSWTDKVIQLKTCQ